MSTITVVKKNEHVAIAADSLTTWGSGKESAEYVVNHDKIIQVGESYLGVSGSTAAKLMLKDYFSKRDVKAQLDSVEGIFRTWKEVHQALKDDYFLNPEEDPDDTVESSRMDVLIANPHGIFGVSAHRAVQEFSKFYAYGTGSEYALGAMYSMYEDESKTAEDVARFGVQAAAEFDDGTGLPSVAYLSRLASRRTLKEVRRGRQR